VTANLSRYVAGADFLASIVAANVLSTQFGLVPIWFGLQVSAGTFAAGAALVARDAVQETNRRRVVAALIVAGAFLSAIGGNWRIAVASGTAFLFSEFVDLAVYTPLRERSRVLAVVASSAVAAPVDSVLFLWISGFGVTWGSVTGQFIVQVAVSFVASAGLVFWGWRRAVPR
jgi:uncharacterized PurR-regulated membrane protein YhhQ (DUF165 family)